MRKLCRQGTEAYRKALIKAGHMNGDVHHTGGQKVLRGAQDRSGASLTINRNKIGFCSVKLAQSHQF